MRKILKNYGISKNTVNATVVIYSSSMIRLGEKLSEALHIATAVLEVDTITPFLSIIALHNFLILT